ncbi:MAG: hypothetical protein JJT90_18645 [Ectothiorhodospiraceae bacterium]|nr:hypothetical protein [Ectothiorhodospiraceae bacterium]
MSVVGGEYVFLQVDRHARGAALEEELEASLALARDELKEALRSHYQNVLYQAHGDWLERLDRSVHQDGVAREFRVLGPREDASRSGLR